MNPDLVQILVHHLCTCMDCETAALALRQRDKPLPPIPVDPHCQRTSIEVDGGRVIVEVWGAPRSCGVKL